MTQNAHERAQELIALAGTDNVATNDLGTNDGRANDNNKDKDFSRAQQTWLREATPAELASVIEAFWVPCPGADRAHDRLLERFHALDLDVPLHDPFDETVEEDVHPILVDAGWELVPLAELDPAWWWPPGAAEVHLTADLDENIAQRIAFPP